MQEQQFRSWLRDVREQVDGSIATRVADCKLVERHEADLDAHWNADGLTGLLDRLTYSREDERNGRSPKHNVPTKGDLYTNSATFKAAVNLYREFLDARGDDGAGRAVAHRERWDRYLEEVRRYVESGKLDREEIDYKSRIAAKLTSARNAVLAGDEDWSDRRTALKRSRSYSRSPEAEELLQGQQTIGLAGSWALPGMQAIRRIVSSERASGRTATRTSTWTMSSQ